MQARIPSITSITSVTTTQQVVATAEAEGVRGSKYAPSSGIFVDRWLSLFAKALRMGREWSSNGGGGGGGGGCRGEGLDVEEAWFLSPPPPPSSAPSALN
mmetsp:Transcript_43069/g.79919  ORF Transcript_43069/g.79919 Transcript_43069/m.79919 type:complete len:100 (+) Transcript_43069:251-550(+)